MALVGTLYFGFCNRCVGSKCSEPGVRRRRRRGDEEGTQDNEAEEVEVKYSALPRVHPVEGQEDGHGQHVEEVVHRGGGEPCL